jgi:hypothetical protein
MRAFSSVDMADMSLVGDLGGALGEGRDGEGEDRRSE